MVKRSWKGRRATTTVAIAALALGGIVGSAVLISKRGHGGGGGGPPPANGTIGLIAQSAVGLSESISVVVNGTVVNVISGNVTPYNYTSSQVTLVAPTVDNNGHAFEQWYNSKTGEHLFTRTITVTLVSGISPDQYLLNAFYA